MGDEGGGFRSIFVADFGVFIIVGRSYRREVVRIKSLGFGVRLNSVFWFFSLGKVGYFLSDRRL